MRRMRRKTKKRRKKMRTMKKMMMAGWGKKERTVTRGAQTATRLMRAMMQRFDYL